MELKEADELLEEVDLGEGVSRLELRNDERRDAI